MRISGLQIYILIKGLDHKKLERNKVLEYYKKKKKAPSLKDQLTVIHRSADRLIDEGYLTGYGKKTSEKWFFNYFRLTPKGRVKARELRKEKQLNLPKI